MPGVQDILSSINQFALARLSGVSSWRAAGFDPSRSLLTGRTAAPEALERAELPESEYAHAGPEPSLDEVLCDPVIQLIMRADGVKAADLQGLSAAQRRHVLSAQGTAAYVR